MRVLLVYNCMAWLVRLAFNALAPQISIRAITYTDYFNSPEEERSLDRYDAVIALPYFFNIVPDRMFADRCEKIELRQFWFTAFHPDICWVQSGDKLIQTSMGDYNSTIAIAGYLSGLDVPEILELYNEDVYEKIGYMSLWDEAVAHIEESYSNLNVDIRAWMARRSVDNTFMDTTNHPKEIIAMDLARILLDCLEIEYDRNLSMDILNGRAGFIWPVYTEIASRYGFRGSYLFKEQGAHTLPKTLSEFVAESLMIYRRYPPESISIVGRPVDALRTQKVLNCIRGLL